MKPWYEHLSVAFIEDYFLYLCSLNFKIPHLPNYFYQSFFRKQLALTPCSSSTVFIPFWIPQLSDHLLRFSVPYSISHKWLLSSIRYIHCVSNRYIIRISTATRTDQKGVLHFRFCNVNCSLNLSNQQFELFQYPWPWAPNLNTIQGFAGRSGNVNLAISCSSVSKHKYPLCLLINSLIIVHTAWSGLWNVVYIMCRLLLINWLSTVIANDVKR